MATAIKVTSSGDGIALGGASATSGKVSCKDNFYIATSNSSQSTALILDRTPSDCASYRLINDIGTLRAQCDYFTSKGSYYDLFSIPSNKTGMTLYQDLRITGVNNNDWPKLKIAPGYETGEYGSEIHLCGKDLGWALQYRTSDNALTIRHKSSTSGTFDLVTWMGPSYISCLRDTYFRQSVYDSTETKIVGTKKIYFNNSDTLTPSTFAQGLWEEMSRSSAEKVAYFRAKFPASMGPNGQPGWFTGIAMVQDSPGGTWGCTMSLLAFTSDIGFAGTLLQPAGNSNYNGFTLTWKSLGMVTAGTSNNPTGSNGNIYIQY